MGRQGGPQREGPVDGGRVGREVVGLTFVGKVGGKVDGGRSARKGQRKGWRETRREGSTAEGRMKFVGNPIGSRGISTHEPERRSRNLDP